MRPLLVLRPEPGASATLERAKALGLQARAIPLFEVEPVSWEPPEAAGFDGLLLTSANAVRHAGEQLQALRGLPAYAVGEATAEAAREAGFDIKSSGDAGVDRLLGSIDRDLKLLHLCGEDRRTPDKAKQDITPLPVYRARAVESPAIAQISGSVALIHSPRLGSRFAELVQDRAETSIAAISQAAAEAAGSGWASVDTADKPNDEALLALGARLCNKSLPK
jgi:uroporphyrinogen-III synthase